MSSSSISSQNIYPQRAKVRVVGKIRNESENQGSDSRCWITVRKPQDDVLSLNKVAVSFSDQSIHASKKTSSYELNGCYHQDEDIDALFTREVKPLISELFNGKDASVVAYGARRSGKTALIQGMSDKPGLSMMAMAEIVSKARDLGKSVFVSMYEVLHEHAYDLLDSKNPEIQVFEDSRGRIKLKGLSQVSVESLSQFEEYRSRSFSGKIVHKIPPEMPKRSHKVVVICLSSMDEPFSISSSRGKMNFVDLAGYEDTRRKSSDGNSTSESVRINKSLHAIMNVIYALNTNDNRIPFRESKLTRILQESLGGSNPILLLACMNPFFCQDTIHTVSVASLSCQNNNRMLTDSTKKGNSSSSVASRSCQNNNRVLPDSSKKRNSSTIVASLSCQNNHVLTDSTKKGDSSIRVQSLLSQKIVKPSGLPKVVKTQVDHSVLLSTKKTSVMSSGRKIKVAKENVCSQIKFPKGDDGSTKMINKLQESSMTEPISQPEEIKFPKGDDGSTKMINKLQESSMTEPISQPEEVEVGQHDSIMEQEGKVICKDGVNNVDATPAVTNEISALDHACDDHAGTVGGGSPPLSERLRELSMNLKLFCSSTPSRLKLLQQETVPVVLTEPNTPETDNRYMNVKNCSPWDAFSKGSSRMKDSLVQESLNFFNTASKEELKKLKGIGEKRATYILELREESPVPFKNVEDLSEIGLSAKQIKGMMKNVAGQLFS